MKWIRFACAAVALASPQMSHALILDFSQALGGAIGGNLGTNTYSSGPVTVDAFYLSADRAYARFGVARIAIEI